MGICSRNRPRCWPGCSWRRTHDAPRETAARTRRLAAGAEGRQGSARRAAMLARQQQWQDEEERGKGEGSKGPASIPSPPPLALK